MVLFGQAEHQVSLTNPLNGVVYGSTQYVAVGGSGAILTSDGIAWTNRTSLTMYYALFGITYANNLYVAIGEMNNIMTSPDSITWTGRTSVSANTLYGITYGSNLFVSVGTRGTFLTSPKASSSVSYRISKINYSILGRTLQIYTLQGRLVAQKKLETENYYDGKSALTKTCQRVFI